MLSRYRNELRGPLAAALEEVIARRQVTAAQATPSGFVQVQETDISVLLQAVAVGGLGGALAEQQLLRLRSVEFQS